MGYKRFKLEIKRDKDHIFSKLCRKNGYYNWGRFKTMQGAMDSLKAHNRNFPGDNIIARVIDNSVSFIG